MADRYFSRRFEHEVNRGVTVKRFFLLLVLSGLLSLFAPVGSAQADSKCAAHCNQQCTRGATFQSCFNSCMTTCKPKTTGNTRKDKAARCNQRCTAGPTFLSCFQSCMN